MTASPPAASRRPVAVATAALALVLVVALAGLAVPALDTTSTDATVERTASTGEVGPGGTVHIVVEVDLDNATSFTIEEDFDGPIEPVEVADADGGTVETASNDTLVVAYEDRETVELEYRLTIDEDQAFIGNTLDIDGAVEGEATHGLGTHEAEVVADPGVAVWIDDAPDEATAGETVTVDATVENLGDETESTTLALSADGTELVDESLELDPFERETVALEFEPTSDDAGTLEYAVSTDTHAVEDTLEVLEPATFAVSDLEAPPTVDEFDTFDASVVVENTGDLAGEQTITLSLDDGTELASEEVALTPGESTELEFDDLGIDDPGVYVLAAASEDDTDTTTIGLEPAEAHVVLEEQTIGADTDGTPALAVEALVAEAGWTVAIVDGNDTVVGTHSVTENRSDERLVVSVAEDVEPGPFEAAIVADDAVEAGDSLGAYDVLASDGALAMSTALSVSPTTADDAIAAVTVDEAHLDTGDGEDRAYMLGVHRVAADDSLELVGTSDVLEGAVSDVTIELDEPIDDLGEHELVVRLHETPFGTLGEPYSGIDGNEFAPVEAPLSVSVVETPTMVVSNVTVDTPVHAGDTMAVTVEVTNEAAVGGTETVWVSTAGQIGLADVTVDGGETDSVTVTVPVSAQAGETVGVAVDVGDDSEIATVEVVEGPEVAAASSPIPGMGIVIVLLGLGIVVGGSAWFHRRR